MATAPPGCCGFGALGKNFDHIQLSTELPGKSDIGSVLQRRRRLGGFGMSFQITILKVLAGHPEGRALLPDLKRAMAILITSRSDWTDRMTRLAARATGPSKNMRCPSQKPSSLMTCRCGQVFNSHRIEDTLVHVPHISAAASEHAR